MSEANVKLTMTVEMQETVGAFERMRDGFARLHRVVSDRVLASASFRESVRQMATHERRVERARVRSQANTASGRRRRKHGSPRGRR